VDYCRDSCRFVAAWFFGQQHQPKVPKNWQLDPYPPRYCNHPGHIKRPRGDLNTSSFANFLQQLYEVFLITESDSREAN